MECLRKIVDHQIVAETRTRATFCKNVHEISSLNFVHQTMILKNFLQEKRPRRHRGQIEGHSGDSSPRGTVESLLLLSFEPLVEPFSSESLLGNKKILTR